jgi:glycosyltransferase involved in cell wall biosynthesis
MKKILLINYYFPPCGGAAVQRWLRLIPELVKAGFQVTVLTTKNGDYTQIDESLLQRIPAEVPVIRTFTPAYGRLWKLFLRKHEPLPYGSLNSTESTTFPKRLSFWFRLNFVAPDARVIWNPFAKYMARKLCRTNQFDWVITSGPPHSTHLIGLYLKTNFKLKWLADFRDPWTQIYYLKMEQQNKIIRMYNKYLEKIVVSSADLNLVVSQDIIKQLPEGNKMVFYNGYDAGLFADLNYNKTDIFRINYIGQLTAGHNIYPLLDFLAKSIHESGIPDIRFSFIGTQNINQAGTALPLRISGYLPHKQAVNEMVNCELLVLLINDYEDNFGMLTTRLFEYLASGTPILYLGPPRGEAANIILKANAGNVAERFDHKVWDYISKVYAAWQADQPIRNDDKCRQFSVQQQITDLAQLLT